MASKKQPYIPLYIGDWDRKCNTLSLEAEGAWLKLTFKLWDSPTRGLLSFCFSQFVILCKKPPEKAREIWDELVKSGVFDLLESENDNYKIASRRMRREIELSKVRSESGSKGGRPKKAKGNQTKTKTKAKAKQNPDNDNDNAIDIDTGIENENASESENGKAGVEGNPENIGSGGLPFQCRQIILGAWEGYQWELKDSQAVKRLIEKIKGVITDSQKRKGEIIGATDQSVIDFLTMLLQKLPKWYAERNRDVEGLDSKFNRIVNEIRNASGQQGSYDSLKRRLAEEIITATGNSR